MYEKGAVFVFFSRGDLAMPDNTIPHHINQLWKFEFLSRLVWAVVLLLVFLSFILPCPFRPCVIKCCGEVGSWERAAGQSLQVIVVR